MPQAHPARGRRTLVTGGTRSGKSLFAENMVRERRADYVATGYPVSDADPDWAERVRAHRARRPEAWTTVETLDLARVCAANSVDPVLVDCLALWLTRTIDALDGWEGGAEADIDQAIADLADAVAATRREVVLVTNEVGLGVVPETASGRLFRDHLGRLNARVAAACDDVWLCVCGIPVAIKTAAARHG